MAVAREDIDRWREAQGLLERAEGEREGKAAFSSLVAMLRLAERAMLAKTGSGRTQVVTHDGADAPVTIRAA